MIHMNSTRETRSRAWKTLLFLAAFTLIPANCGMTPWELQVKLPPVMATGPGGLKGDKIILDADGCAHAKENSGIKMIRLSDGRIRMTYAHPGAVVQWIIESVETQREEHLQYLLKMKPENSKDAKIERAIVIPGDDGKKIIWSLPDQQHTVYRPVKCFRLKNGKRL